MPAFVIHDFVPRRTYESPSRMARVLMFATSLPASGSERQYLPWNSPDATRGTYRSWSSELPCLRIGVIASFEMMTNNDEDAQTRATSSTSRANVNVSAPSPPNDSGYP